MMKTTMRTTTQRTLRKKGGFSLVELIVASAIMTLVIGLVFTFFLHNSDIFRRGDNLSDVQNDIRMASDYLTKEVRNVTDISLDTALTSEINASTLQALYTSVSALQVSIEAEGDFYILNYVLQGQDDQGENPYQVVSAVLLNNIKAVDGSLSGTAVYYAK